MSGVLRRNRFPRLASARPFFCYPHSHSNTTNTNLKLLRPSTMAHSSTSASGHAQPARRAVADKIPADAWDSHMHVVDPFKYAVSAKARYTPTHAHTLADAEAFFGSYGLRNMVIVQPSIYGTDNSCTLDALRALGPSRGRAVVEIDPAEHAGDPARSTLRAWHALGARGVRLNLKSVGRVLSQAELARELRAYADAIRPLRTWVLQVYLSLDMVPMLEAVVPELGDGVKVCVDHFGHPTLPEKASAAVPAADNGTAVVDPYALPGFDALVRLVRQGSTWVKVSAAYRIETDPAMPWVAAMARELLRVADGRLVFATDWPHTRFDGMDVEPFVEKCIEWCDGDAAKVARLFRENAEELWDVQR